MKSLLDWSVAKLNFHYKDKWKDRIFGTGGVVFTLFLLPAVFSDDKPPVASSLPTALFLYAFVVAHWANGDRKGAFWSAACATVWLVLTLQKVFG